MNLTDTHCHLFFDSYQEDLDQVLERARREGVNRILVPAIDLASSEAVLSLIEREQILYGAVGVHPTSTLGWNDSDLAVFKEMAHHPKVVAVGEIGLDYYHAGTPVEGQKEILSKQLQLASDCGLPVVLHVRNRSEEDRSCTEDLLGMLEAWLQAQDGGMPHRSASPGVIHSFSGNESEAQRAVEAGFYLGITGPITYRNAGTLRNVVKHVGPAHLLVETDGPFLSPQEFRGKRNEPAHVRCIVDKISEVVGQPSGEIALMTAENAASLFMWE